MFKTYYTYILTNQPRGTLYIGITGDLDSRMRTHKALLVDGFSKRYKLTKLVYKEAFGTPTEAIAYEKKLKHWPRQWKINLIEIDNPHWQDLAWDWK